MKKCLSILAFSLSLLSLLQAQDSTSFKLNYLRPQRLKHTIFVNLLGNGCPLGINYDRAIDINRNLFFSLRGGIAYNQISKGFLSSERGDGCLVFPHQATVNVGGGVHYLELGIGGSVFSTPPEKEYVAYTSVGYRVQPFRRRQGFFRVYGSFIINDDRSKYFLPSNGYVPFCPVGVSVGGSF